MKYLAIFACLFFIPATAYSQKADKAHKELLKKSPFNKMYPKNLAPAAAKYFGAFNKGLFAKGAIASKEARLVAIAASAVIRCEYCITAQVMLAKKAGASDDEIKSAIQIAGEIARFSILLYGNEFGQDKLKAILKKMMAAKPKAKAKKAAKGPFDYMYPKNLEPAAAKYFGAFNKALFAKGAIAPKASRLVAIAASSAIRCEYCITAQVMLAKKAGASDDEIKSAIQIAGEIARFSILLYGNEFGQDKLKAILTKMTSAKPKKKAAKKGKKKAKK